MEQCLLNKHSIKPACDMYGGEDKTQTGLWWENTKKRDHFGDLGIDAVLK
jgi:hypothetical protein